MARRPARRRRRARTGAFSAAGVRGHRRHRLSGRRHLRAVHRLRGRDRRDRARLGGLRAVQPRNSPRRGQRLPGQAALRRGRAGSRRARGRLLRERRHGGLAGGIRGNRRKRGDDARRLHRPGRGRARPVRLGARPQPHVLRPLVPARRRARRRTRRSAQHRGPGVAAPGDGRGRARATFGPDCGLRLPLEPGAAAARTGVGGVRAAGGAAAPVASRDRRRDGRPGHPPDAARHGRRARARGRADGHRGGFGGADDGAHPADARAGVAVPARAKPYPCVRERSRRAGARARRGRGRSRRRRAVRARGAGDRRPRLAGGSSSPRARRAAGQAHGPDPGHARAREERGRHPRPRPGRAPRGSAGPSRSSPMLSALRRLLPLGTARPRPA